MRAVAILPVLLFLPACSLFDNSDPREGVEPQAECMARYADTLGRQGRNLLVESSDDVVPTFTYDVTKMDLEAMKVLMVDGSDQSAGRRLTGQHNELSTAVARFKAEPVSEKGAFFLGHDPALYRVRGKTQPLKNVLAAACERQQANMRLVGIDFTTPTAAPEQTDASNDETGT
uniref:hypothetical protein n=1 Tax=uncultured Erythrobacter sp. TaxID=263913 RepID=UPI002618F345|nr:hypothetical protein [uncultured Erythrobacter sp.]